jgi:hypothetical protein
MKITIESTDKTVLLATDTGDVPARMWQGETESGIPVFCFITRICPEVLPGHPRFDEAIAEFEAELRACVPARPAVEAFDMRLII